MIEACIILPCAAGIASEEALDSIAKQFGGYTATQGTGAWIDDNGKRVVENVKVVDIAMVNSIENTNKLWRIALDFGRNGKQDCVYVRYPNGEVQLVDTREQWIKEAA